MTRAIETGGHRRGLTAGLLCVIALLCLSRPAVSAGREARTSEARGRLSAQAELTVSPAQVQKGGRLEIAGTRFPARRVGVILLGHRRLGRFRADRHGAWRLRVRAPRRARMGRQALRVSIRGHRVMAVQIRIARRSSGATLARLAGGEQVLLSSTRVAAGSVVRISGSGFRRGERVSVALGRRRLSITHARSRGRLLATVRIPAATRGQTQSLWLSFRRRQISISLAILSHRAAGPPPPTSSTPASPVVDAVGDIACSPSDPDYNGGNGTPTAVPPAHNCMQQAVSNAIAAQPPTALLDLGDNQYDSGSLSEYDSVYANTLGRENSIVYPVLGNAEYGAEYTNNTPTAPTGFFAYFAPVLQRIAALPGANVSNIADGYYSFDLGAWHIIALNSNCAEPITSSFCSMTTEVQWLQADLAAHPNLCTLAYWHHPRWNSNADPNAPVYGTGNDSSVAPFWTALYGHADVVLDGHANHHYERFLPQNPSGQPDPAHGITEFIVATGGQSHGLPPSARYKIDTATSAITNYTNYGFLRLVLHPTSYDWTFVPAAATPPGSAVFTDSGTAPCH